MNVLMGLVVIYSETDQYEKIIKYGKQSLRIAQKIGDRQSEVELHGNLGETYYLFDQFEKAIENFEQGIEIAQEIGDREAESVLLMKLLEVS